MISFFFHSIERLMVAVMDSFTLAIRTHTNITSTTVDSVYRSYATIFFTHKQTLTREYHCERSNSKVAAKVIFRIIDQQIYIYIYVRFVVVCLLLSCACIMNFQRRYTHSSLMMLMLPP